MYVMLQVCPCVTHPLAKVRLCAHIKFPATVVVSASHCPKTNTPQIIL
jgi:hypothetical protein